MATGSIADTPSRSTIHAAARGSPPEEVDAGATGIYYFVPCVSKEGGHRGDGARPQATDEPLSSEDMALLTAVAAQAATALENGRLYRQLHLKADELDGCVSSTRTS